MNWVLLIVSLLMWNATGHPQASDSASTRLDNASVNYLRALNSENPGMVESAIFCVVKLKLFFPEQDTGSLHTALVGLAGNGSSERIRYEAFLAAMVLGHPNWLSRIEKKNYKDSEAFFNMLSDSMQTKLLSMRNED